MNETNDNTPINWSRIKLTIGIISIILALIIAIASIFIWCALKTAAAVAFSFSAVFSILLIKGDPTPNLDSNFFTFFKNRYYAYILLIVAAVFMLVAGILCIATKKSHKKLWPVLNTILYWVSVPLIIWGYYQFFFSISGLRFAFFPFLIFTIIPFCFGLINLFNCSTFQNKKACRTLFLSTFWTSIIAFIAEIVIVLYEIL